jgi:hypothetical protein
MKEKQIVFYGAQNVKVKEAALDGYSVICTKVEGLEPG